MVLHFHCMTCGDDASVFLEGASFLLNLLPKVGYRYLIWPYPSLLRIQAGPSLELVAAPLVEKNCLCKVVVTVKVMRRLDQAEGVDFVKLPLLARCLWELATIPSVKYRCSLCD